MTVYSYSIFDEYEAHVKCIQNSFPSPPRCLLRAADPEFDSRLRQDFSELSHSSDLKLALLWLPCQASGVIGSTLEVVAQCQYTVIGRDRNLICSLLSQCGSTSSCLSRSVPEIQ